MADLQKLRTSPWPRTLGVARVMFELVLLGVVAVLAVRPPHPGFFWRHHLIIQGVTKDKVVALTYDDGPHPEYTPELLDILDKYHVKATFFMVGSNMVKYPDVVHEVARRGHAIGNHTYTHPHNIELETHEQIVGELDRTEQVIERMTGHRTQIFRPPLGLIDGSVFTAAEDEGYRTVLWSVSADHKDAPTPEAMAARVVQHLQPGAIILAHDGRYKIRWKDVAATPLIIEALQKRGYRFVTIPELLAIEEREHRPPLAGWWPWKLR